MDTDGNEWMRPGAPQVYVRVWHGPTAVAHYRADLVTAHRYVEGMRGQLRGLRYTIDPLPTFAPPTRPLPAWQLEQTAP